MGDANDPKTDYEMARRVDRLGWKSHEIEESIKRTDANLENLRLDVKFTMKCQQEDHEAFIKYTAAQTAAANAIAEAAKKSATGKQLYLSAAAVILAVPAAVLLIVSQIH